MTGSEEETTPPKAEEPAARISSDASFWAKPVERLDVSVDAPGPRTVAGRRQVSPLQGFGKMWQKTYRVKLGSSVSPNEVIKVWKENFPKFWPKGNTFYSPLTGIAPGEVAVINLGMPGGLKLSTGVLVLYADEESFTLMTPQGHMLAGWITFSAYEKAGVTEAQAQVQMRASDPLFELGLMFGGHRKEDNFWKHTLSSLGSHFGQETEVEMQVLCIDPKRQWKNWKNIRHNSGIGSGIYMALAPFRLVARPFRRKKRRAAPERQMLEND